MLYILIIVGFRSDDLHVFVLCESGAMRAAPSGARQLCTNMADAWINKVGRAAILIQFLE